MTSIYPSFLSDVKNDFVMVAPTSADLIIPYEAEGHGRTSQGPKPSYQELPRFLRKEQKDCEGDEGEPYSRGERGGGKDLVAPGMIDDEELEQYFEADADEDQPVREKAPAEHRVPGRAAGENVPDLHQDDPQERGGRGLPDERMVKGERHAPAPPALVEHQEIGGERADGADESEENITSQEQGPVNEPVLPRSRRIFHNVRLRPLDAERKGGDGLGAEVDGKDLHDRDGQRNVEDRVQDVRDRLRGQMGEDIGDELPNIFKDRPALLDRVYDGREVVIQQDHVRRLLGHVRPGESHGDADVGPFERRGVVHAVAGDRNPLALILQDVHDTSPVIMMILMPASPHFLRASGTSGRGGSSSPIKPAKIKSCSAVTLSGSSSPEKTSRYANARTRSPRSMRE